jgi:hypothetical protein
MRALGPGVCPSCYLASSLGSTQEQFTFPRLDIRCAMTQSYRIVRSEYCCSSHRQYQYLTAWPVS